MHSIGEESYSSGNRPSLTDLPTFCVDPIGEFPAPFASTTIRLTFPRNSRNPPFNSLTYPLDPDALDYSVHLPADGTTNFVHGFPHACISLGLIDHRVPVLGVIYNPFLEHLYTGVRGAGSFLHTHTPAALDTDTPTSSAIGVPQRLPLAPASGRPLPSLAGALIAVEWGLGRAKEPLRCQVDSFSRLAGAPPHSVMAHSLRSVGSAALNFALVAQGALDLYWYVSSPLSLLFFLIW